MSGGTTLTRRVHVTRVAVTEDATLSATYDPA